MRPVLELAASPTVVRRATRYAVVVGMVLIAINHGDALLRGDLPPTRLVRMLLTALVPYVVSTLSSVEALRGPAAPTSEPSPSSKVSLMPTIPLVASGPHSWPAIRGASRLLLLYKHSPQCNVSAVARAEVEAFTRSAPQVPVLEVDVIHQRPLAAAIAADLGVEHASPQAILLCEGQVVWHASHFRLTAAALVEQVARSQAGCAAGAVEVGRRVS